MGSFVCVRGALGGGPVWQNRKSFRLVAILHVETAVSEFLERKGNGHFFRVTERDYRIQIGSKLAVRAVDLDE